jgi:hypothetical protein
MKVTTDLSMLIIIIDLMKILGVGLILFERKIIG